MAIVGFQDNHGGQRRIAVQEAVGGRGLSEDPCTFMESLDYTGGELQVWSWGDGAHERLVATNVMETAPTSVVGMVNERSFPPDGGVGMSALALWSWYPKEGAEDELLFPKGAELRECKDVNGDWYHGTFMGMRGLFPAPYVRVLDNGSA